MSASTEPSGPSLSSSVLVAVLFGVLAFAVGRQFVGGAEVPIENGFDPSVTLPLQEDTTGETWQAPDVGRDPFDPGEAPVFVPEVDEGDLDGLSGDAGADEG